MKHITGVIYRPPNTDIDKFLIAFYALFTSISKYKTECLLAGDFNTHWSFKSDVHSDTEHFINNLHCDLLIPLIVWPTCFETHSSTLLTIFLQIALMTYVYLMHWLLMTYQTTCLFYTFHRIQSNRNCRNIALILLACKPQIILHLSSPL